MDEVICDGDVLGTLRFDVIRNVFNFFPRPVGAIRLLRGVACRKIVVVDEGAVEPILRGASVLVPGILSYDPSIRKEDVVIVTNSSQTLIAIGSSRMNFDSLKNISRGMAVKIRHKNLSSMLKQPLSRGQSWEYVLKANSGIIQEVEEEATEFVKGSLTRYKDKPALVAYSGGKDSLATILLVQSVMKQKTRAFFVDTGLEFPETRENVQSIKTELGIPFLEREADVKQFWSQFTGGFGPPSRDNRWCTKSQKLSPINQLIKQEFPEGVLTFIGNRKYESRARSQKKRIARNPWTPKQISASPIQDWSALHVYLYLMKHKKMGLLNPLYNKGLARVGCWVCPATNLGDFQLIAELHPELFGQFEEHLKDWCIRHGLPDAYIKLGLWRWRKFPKKILNILDKLGLASIGTRTNDVTLSFRTTETVSPYTLDGYSLQVRSSRTLNLKSITRFFPTIGSDTIHSDQFGMLSVNCYMEKGKVSVFTDGTIIIQTVSQENAKNILTAVKKVVLRGEGCQVCRTCIHHCPQDAIRISNDGYIQVTDNCTGCGQCAEFCPLIKYELLLNKNE